MDTLQLLKDNNACSEGVEYFEDTYDSNISVDDLLISELEKESDYAPWAMENLNTYIKDTQRLKDNISYSDDAYLYCKYVEDTKEMRDKITASFDAYRYCRYIKDTKEMSDKITAYDDAYLYCKDIKDTKEMRDKINN